MLSPNEATRLAAREATSEAPELATGRQRTVCAKGSISRIITRSTEPLAPLRGNASGVGKLTGVGKLILIFLRARLTNGVNGDTLEAAMTYAIC
jgi:hypothetical protein